MPLNSVQTSCVREPTNGRGGHQQKMLDRKQVFNAGTTYKDHKQVRCIKKSDDDRAKIRDYAQTSCILGILERKQLDDIIDLMDIVTLSQGQKEKIDNGLCIIVLDGSVTRFQQKQAKESYKAGDFFGELALLYKQHDCSDDQFLQASAKARICKLPRDTFLHTMELSRQLRIKENVRLLGSIPEFKQTSMPERIRIADACEERSYEQGQTIVKEGNIVELKIQVGFRKNVRRFALAE